jgi:hypothetical protein
MLSLKTFARFGAVFDVKLGQALDGDPDGISRPQTVVA